MDKILDIVNGWITAAVPSGVLQTKQVLLLIFTAGPVTLAIWRIRGIVVSVNEVRSSKLDKLQYLLDSHELSNEASICVKEGIKRIISYRVAGISDVASRKIILRLLIKSRDSISVGFFKRSRTFLPIKDGIPVLKKGFSFRFGGGMYAFSSLHLLLIAALLLILSIHRYEQTPVWEHLTLYPVAVVMFLFFIVFGKMISRPEECNLLNKVLQAQYSDSFE